MNIIDTHCHLISSVFTDQFFPVLERAKNAGVTKIINVAYDLSSSHVVLEQIKQSDMLYGALGIQPDHAQEYTHNIAEQIAILAQSSQKIVAIGEIGLDAYRQSSRDTLNEQTVCFEHFLNIACSLNLPVIVHVRNTHTEVHTLIAKYSKRGLRGVIHCFTGTEQEAKQFLDCGFFISFAGVVTFKNAQILANVAQMIPDDRILIETDSPYLAPTPMRGKTNEPSFLAYICEFLAQKRGVSIEEFAHQTYHNSCDLFFIDR